MLLAETLAEINDHIIVEGSVFPTSNLDAIATANAATKSAGRTPIGNRWRELSESPLDALTYHVGHDLAYPSKQWFTNHKCRELAESLMCHAAPESQWLTNNSKVRVGPHGSRNYSSTPVTDWTFDAAFVAVGSRNTLFLCFMAED